MFLNPLMLLGIAGIAGPILIHLFMNRRVQRVTWAAMQFIQDAVQKNRRRMNVEDMLLLLLRCLILALIALAMARPAVRSPITSLLGQSKVVVAVVLDNSASTALSDGTISRFDLSKKIAAEMVADLPRGSSVAVYLSSDAPTPLIPDPTRDMALARQSIEQAQRSDRPSNLLPALTQVCKMLSGQTATRKELWIISDGQAMAFSQLSDISALLARYRDLVHATFVLDGIPESHNLAVTNIELADGQFAAVGQPLNFNVQVTNFGADRADGVPVSLQIDGASSERAIAKGQTESIPPGQARSIVLAATMKDGGYHSITAQLSHDRMPADDQRTVALRVFEQVQILLVTSDANPDSRQSATYFVHQALSPVPASDRDKYFVHTRTVSADQVDGVRLGDYQLVILADVSRVSPAATEALTKFVQIGGGLMLFPGPMTDPTFYNQQLAGLLPAKLGAPRGDAAGEADDSATVKSVSFQSGDYAHPIVQLWSDPSAGKLATARFFRTFPLAPLESSHASPVNTILKFSDGSPAMVSRRTGVGEVILFASTANTAWNDLPVRPAFLPLLYRTMAELLARGEQGTNLRVGDPFTFLTGAEYVDHEATIVRPQNTGEKGTRGFGKVELVHGQPTVNYSETDRAGAYALTLAGDKPLQVTFAAQPDSRESDLTLLDRTQTDQLAKDAKVIWSQPDSQVREMMQSDRVGKELWFSLGVAALVLAGVEMLLADWFSRPK